MNQESITKSKVIPTFRIFAKAGMFQDYRVCPHCGQNEFPFKKGICLKCCNQVGDVQYVKDSQEYVKSNYGDIKMGIRELYQGLDEK